MVNVSKALRGNEKKIVEEFDIYGFASEIDIQILKNERESLLGTIKREQALFFASEGMRIGKKIVGEANRKDGGAL